MVKLKETYVCSSCGAGAPQWRGQCPRCGEWNTLQSVVVEKNRPAGRAGRHAAVAASRPVRLKDVTEQHHTPFGTGIAELDRILGRGLVPGAALLVGGEPGIGKSTLLLQVAGAVAASGRSVLYLSGEESLGQLRGRAERLGVLYDTMLAVSSSRVEDALPMLEEQPAPDLLIVDSVQTLTSTRAEGLPGSVSQVRAVSTELAEKCRACGTCVLFVGHVTKDGQLAGPKLLEHMVDTVISLEGDRRQQFRMLRVLKNRFGPNQELLVFRMVQQGLDLVDDPSTFFLDARDPSLSGTSVVMTVDGQRPFAVEMQALVTRSYLSIPRRTALGFDVNRLHLLLAVLEKRLRLNFGQVDIYAKVGGGMRVQDPGMDLALVAAILSSFYDVPLPARSVFWGEVDLNGQIRPVSAQSVRSVQAKRLGYSSMFCPEEGGTGVTTIGMLQEKLFRNPAADA
ncbi:DNA repair protein RadA [Oleidesulfovibrio alaskensis]|uniref:DNA repair protein RadA n=1 Tax=Oleidesulfovibrio alaskensis TaxID=58180 RepID=UPI00040EFB0E|nr:DNA repair protein RadA [Oleidesulfovibrio alaskensis]MBG0772304.1 DNA repair protein RadA [Oleidesulfovibrio alaskensis]MBL3581044.1 DNA repair protein RadA [Oleidesulfovibrio alaskensis]